jgi:hypothetical protein
LQVIAQPIENSQLTTDSGRGPFPWQPALHVTGCRRGDRLVSVLAAAGCGTTSWPAGI